MKKELSCKGCKHFLTGETGSIGVCTLTGIVLKEIEICDKYESPSECNYTTHAIRIDANEINALNKLSSALYGEGLRLVNYTNAGWNKDKKSYYTVTHKDFANPMFFFDINARGKDYNGTVEFKSVNASLYTPLQVYRAIRLVNEFLMGDE